jgi:hypothetical protein
MSAAKADLALTLESTGLTLRGIADGLRQWCCGRGLGAKFTNEDHSFLAVLYERLEDEAETLDALEAGISKRAVAGAPAVHPPLDEPVTWGQRIADCPVCGAAIMDKGEDTPAEPTVLPLRRRAAHPKEGA